MECVKEAAGNRSVRVLLNTRLLMCSNRAGIGFYVANLYHELKEAGVDVVPTLDDASIALVRSIGDLSARMRTTFGKYYPPFVKKMGDAVYRRLHRKDAAATPYDLYHETSLDPIPSIGARSVCNVYDLAVMRFPELFTNDFAKNVTPNILRNILVSERVIVNTSFIRDEAIEILNIPPEKIDVIPLATAECYGEAKDTSKVPGEVRKITRRNYLLYVGTVEPRKNLKTLIRAYKDVRAKFDVALVIAGGLGWLYDDIVSYPEKLGIGKDVVFTNYVNGGTLRALYQFASVFVYPSLYEGFGIPPLEAMACGVPVIVSDIPPHREVSGDAAIFFDPADHEALADAIARVLPDASLRADLKEKGISKASEYSWQKVAAETIRTYQKALRN